ncbi:uncharacterized protein LOC117107771 [Anneissia japonica]|uniref:uncharacterized protein LOC117107771 n=1 Tax=Anneissia japonica TaxID=1529436 RepID=UPI0014254B7E|nr:uncharacterized protein LOC117107771 [Anneissia japonica]
MSKCSAVGCGRRVARNSKSLNHSFYRFPREKERCTKWIENSGRHDLLQKSIDYIYSNHRICSDHFERSQLLCTGRLVWNAIPTKFGSTNPPHPILFKRIVPVPILLKKGNNQTSGATRAEVEHSYARHNNIGHSSTNGPVTPVQVTRNVNVAEKVAESGTEPSTQRAPDVYAKYKIDMAFHNYAKYYSNGTEPDVQSYQHSIPCTRPEVRDKSTQKGEISKNSKKKSESAKRVELYRLRCKVKKLQSRVNHFNECTLSTTEKIIASAKEYLNETSLQFFACQLRMSSRRGKGRRYTDEDMKLAFDLYKQNSKAYRFCKKIFTLPIASSLRRWVKKMNAEADPNTPRLELPMRKSAKKKKPGKRGRPKKVKQKSGPDETPSGLLQEKGTTKPQRKVGPKKKKQQSSLNNVPPSNPSDNILVRNTSTNIPCDSIVSNNTSSSNTTIPVVIMGNGMTEAETSVLCLSTFNGMII